MLAPPASTPGAAPDLSASLDALRAEAEAAVAATTSPAEIEEVRIRFFSKKGSITALSRGLGQLAPEARPAAGAAINALKEQVAALVEARAAWLVEEAERARMMAEGVDVTLPGVRALAGRPHPINQTMDDMRAILASLGFSFREYPEVETEYHNFDALNQPDWHPARDMHDTFYLSGGGLLRTHTTAFQGRIMRLRGTPPMREMTTGRCYRNDDMDATHSPAFHQLDGFSVSRDASLGELKWVLGRLATELFGSATKTRFRPSFFPFTTPSAEVDVTCVLCGGTGCRVCKHSGWVEVLGCGMMRPEVLRMADLDPTVWRGYAFGIGVDRITMLRWGIDDIRLLAENDVAFLSQF